MTDAKTHYFDSEGRDHLASCITHALSWCSHSGINVLVIFTGNGEGAIRAAASLPQDEYQNLKLVAVTPPFGKRYFADPTNPQASSVAVAGIPQARQEQLRELGVPIVSAHLPFKEMHDGRGGMVSEWSRVTAAMGILGGGFALCVQAVLMACDAGEVSPGDRVVVMSADTAFAAIASRSDSFLSPTEGLLVEHIICRPARYQISKQHHLRVLATAPQSTAPDEIEVRGAIPPSAEAPLPRALPQPAAALTSNKKRRRRAPE